MSDREQSAELGSPALEPTEVIPIPLSPESGSGSPVRRYSFRGEFWSRPNLLAALQRALAKDEPEAADWSYLVDLAESEYASEAPAFITAQICLALQGDETRQRPGLRKLAGYIASGRLAEPVVRTLAAVNSVLPHELALWALSHWTTPVAMETVEALQPLLWRRKATDEAQLAAASVLFRSVSGNRKESRALLKSLTRRCSKQRSLDRLHQLEVSVGPHPFIRRRIAKVENRLFMRCPRCGVERRRPQMIGHLWRRHRLLLDGKRVREPWRLVEDWIDEYARTSNPEFLHRCEALAAKLDAERGSARLKRMLQARGPGHEAVLATWLADARAQHATLCPSCYIPLPLPPQEVSSRLNLARGRLSGDGYSVEVQEHGVVPHLRIETPEQAFYDGNEPDIWFTSLGFWLLFSLPTFVLAVTLALILRLLDSESRLPVIAVLIIGAAIYLVQRGQRRKLASALSRAVNHAWTILVPKLLREEPTRATRSFLTGLASVSLRRGHAQRRAQQLQQAIQECEQAVRHEAGLLPELTILRRLEASDAAAMGADPIPLVADQIARSFAAELPVPYAQAVLEEWEESWWTKLNLARLRVLLCDQAFEIGLEVRDLLHAGHVSPALGQVLNVTDKDGICALRWLWSQRAQRPWDQWGGSAQTVFELAEVPGDSKSPLAMHPDLLLLDAELSPIVVCQRGVYFLEMLFTEFPRYLEVKTRRHETRVEYEILIGSTRFSVPSDPTNLIRRLERWIRFHKEEMLPRLSDVLRWPRPPETRPLLWGETVTCGECKETFLPEAGKLGRRTVDALAQQEELE